MIKRYLLLAGVFATIHNSLCVYKVTVIGSGYVGLVLGTGLAEFGNIVTCVDLDTEKIQALNNGIIPIFEPQLPEIIAKNVKEKRLFFSAAIDESIKTADAIFIAVGTPTKPDGTADISAVELVVERISKHINKPTLICTKSTVPIGTNHAIEIFFKNRGMADLAIIVSNPEFLREGSAVHDFFNPDRIVIGTNSSLGSDMMRQLFAPLFEKQTPVLITDPTTAETIKYASNAFLAVKLSYVNEIDRLCQAVGANTHEVTYGMGLDPRIGKYYLKPGPGFGGSCLPKDTRALLQTATENGIKLSMVSAALEANNDQRAWIIHKIKSHLGNTLQNKKIGIWGLAFKANTDDIRESAALYVIKELLANGAQIKAYDPAAMQNFKKEFPTLCYCSNKKEATESIDLLIILTDWDEFKEVHNDQFHLSMEKIKILDTRNILFK